MKLKSVSFSLILAIGSLSVMEALWWNKAPQSYPRSFFSAAPEGANDLQSLRQACGTPLQVESHDGTTLARCGTFWPFREIWVMPGNVIGPALTKSQTN